MSAAGWIHDCFTVAAELGLHARPAGEFAALARSFDAEIQVSKGGEWVNGREVLELLSLAAAQGARLRLRARGPEAGRAVAALGALLERPPPGADCPRRGLLLLSRPPPPPAHFPSLPRSSNFMATSLFTSESVSMGHPDKLCDQISDAVLDAVLDLKLDSALPVAERRVACEALTTTGLVVLAGEVRATGQRTEVAVNYAPLVREVVREIGYTDSKIGFDAGTCAVMVAIGEQSADIALGVDAGDGKEQGAGDQGMMFGFACDETEALMPAPIWHAHELMREHRRYFESREIRYLRPDAKSQVTFGYDGEGRPQRVDAVVLSTQHDADIPHSEIEKDVKEKIILPVLSNWVDERTEYHINPTGNFVTGGPKGDAGLTGRKIIVDTYGGMGRHGGGAFSGKDPSKVDRSAAYAARWVAKNLVAAGLARRCEVQIAYAIGVAEPVSVRVDSFGTSQHGDARLAKVVRDCFDLRPRAIIEELGLLRREHHGAKWRYRDTACYGHFGRKGFPWEDTGKAGELRRRAER